MTTEGSDAPPGRADVELRLPADSAYASVLRTTTAALATRLDFTIEDIEDLRVAVTEASAVALAHADPGAVLECRFWLLTDRIEVALDVATSGAAQVDADSFAWQVLTSLAEASTRADSDRLHLRLGLSSTVVPGG